VAIGHGLQDCDVSGHVVSAAEVSVNDESPVSGFSGHALENSKLASASRIDESGATFRIVIGTLSAGASQEASLESL
jgi:hypothetical protein